MGIQCGLNGLRQGDRDFKFNQRIRTCTVGIERQIWLYLCAQFETVFLMWQKDDQWATGFPVSIPNEASGLGWTERKTYFKRKIERWCCFLAWDIGYPRPMRWLGICFYSARWKSSLKLWWFGWDIPGCLEETALLYHISRRACMSGHRVVVCSRIYGVLGRSSEQPVLWKVHRSIPTYWERSRLRSDWASTSIL